VHESEEHGQSYYYNKVSRSGAKTRSPRSPGDGGKGQKNPKTAETRNHGLMNQRVPFFDLCETSSEHLRADGRRL